MDTQKELIFIKDTDKTDSIESISFEGGKCCVKYKGRDIAYTYNRDNVCCFELKQTIDPSSVEVKINGKELSEIQQILDYGAYYKITGPKFGKVYPKAAVQIRKNCLSQVVCRERFDYFRRIAEEISLKTETGFNLLKSQYQKVNSVSEETVLASYLSECPTVEMRRSPEVLIYPFGLNQSQKKAVENAFASQISIIQGPPGTGKTQTILNIIANAICNGQTVAVVSNNNTAAHNVLEKLKKENFDFVAAFLGSNDNKNAFLEAQTGSYPNMRGWELSQQDYLRMYDQVKVLIDEIEQRMNSKKRIAEIDQTLLELDPERHYFEEYYQECQKADGISGLYLGAEKALALWNEYEAMKESSKKVRFFTKLRILLQYKYKALRLIRQEPSVVIPYLQKQYYIAKSAELHKEREQLERTLEHYSFEEKAKELSEKSMSLFRHRLAQRYHGGNKTRHKFEKADFSSSCDEFNMEYPVVLSSTYSIKGTLRNHVYDYVIVDEASQVNLVTGVLAFACARNVVVVGDMKQLPNVIDQQERCAADAFWDDRLGSDYQFTKHSLLSSAIAVWEKAPSAMLREHYRCHPKIINFCNQRFYGGELIVMTKDSGEPDVLSMYCTTEGNHAREKQNQREVDVIVKEVLPKLKEAGYHDIGVITPYTDQVSALEQVLPEDVEVSTVHKCQGREKEVIILSSVDNIITDFVDDYHMVNVAVSRAVRMLVVVTSQNTKQDKRNYGDLARYIAYHNFDIIDSTTYSVFDLLYTEYEKQRTEFLKKHKQISEYPSENLMYAELENILRQPQYQQVSCAVHVSLSNIVKDFSALTLDEQVYARNPLTHTDFLIYSRVDKTPLLAIEVDGVSYHAEGTQQAERDVKKDHIFTVCGIPLLRLPTDGSGEREKIEAALDDILFV